MQRDCDVVAGCDTLGAQLLGGNQNPFEEFQLCLFNSVLLPFSWAASFRLSTSPKCPRNWRLSQVE